MATSERRCHYEVLGLQMDCSADEIRSAYKKLALQLHPDKLVQSGLSHSEATSKFQELSHAYEVLSDPKERSWYDSHRSKILFAEPSSNSVIPDLFSYFSNSAFSGYNSDSKKSFFRVYSDVFSRVYANELDFARKMGLGPDAVREAPAMGDLGSPYAQASAFYTYWMGFSTVMDFCWADIYDAAAGVNRKSRRVMEEENKKARRKARREYNETVRGLAEFARKRDKRVIDMAVKKKEEEERRKAEERERRQREERARMERAMAYEEPDWAKADNAEVEDDYDDTEKGAAEEEEELYCVVCGKKFKSEKQWKNHEQSKKHKENVSRIRQEVISEEDSGGDEEEVEELEDMMKDAVRIGPSDNKDDDSEFVESNEENDNDNVATEEEEEKDDDNVVIEEEEEKDDGNAKEETVEEDEIGVLEAMLGGRKNRKKAASVLRKDDENDSDGDMEYNNRKSTRKSRRARKGKNINQEAEKLDSNGNDTIFVAENETSTQEDEDSLSENKKQTCATQRIDKKGIANSETNFVSKSKTSSKGKKAKTSSKNTSNACEKCGEEFESKNKLHKHLSDTGHASLKYR